MWSMISIVVFVKPEASEKELVMMGRISTVGMMFLAALLALQLTNAKTIIRLYHPLWCRYRPYFYPKMVLVAHQCME